MKVLFLNAVLDFYLIPQDYPLITDTLTLTLCNESSGKTITPEVTFTLGEQLKVNITTQPEDFAIQNKYEIELKNGTTLIYSGKIIILAVGTDIQNYDSSSQPNAKYGYKNQG